MDDCDVYKKYPRLRKFHNKLWVAEQMGYNCGPAGIGPLTSGKYVVRPIYNLAGMGVGARVQHIEAYDDESVEAGYFWCEYIEGEHLSMDFKFRSGVKAEWVPIHGCVGKNSSDNLTKFFEWKRIDIKTHPIPNIPRFVEETFQVPQINIEFINGKIIEIHLRESQELEWDYIIPVWNSISTIEYKEYKDKGYTFVKDFENADSLLEDPRLGFFCK